MMSSPGTGVQQAPKLSALPSVPASAQLVQVWSQALSQHTPSTQKAESHSPAVAQGWPDGFYNADTNPDARLLSVGGICEDAMSGILAGISTYGRW